MTALRVARVTLSLCRRRWAPVVGVIILLSVLARWGLPSRSVMPTNVWDVEFGVLDTPFSVMVLLPMLYAVSSLDAATNDLRQWRAWPLLRVSHRSAWWAGKLLATVGMMVAYIGLLTGIPLGVAAVTEPWSIKWSSAALRAPTLASALLAHTYHSPLAALGANLLLLGPGFVALGCCLLTLTLFAREDLAGAVAGAMSIAAYALWVWAPARGVWIPPYQWLLLAHNPVDVKVPTWFTSWSSLGLDLGWASLSVTLATWRLSRMML
ncbi:MAG: hypothetical protein K6V97_14965 [Actinomycetia bacterium]|nr:hypothetical protein [Actinomycetes bacterium]